MYAQKLSENVGKPFIVDYKVGGGFIVGINFVRSAPPDGYNILVAWNASREAARAVTDAIPLLQKAENVQVVAFDPGKGGADHGDVPGADVGLWLARHGVKVQVAQQNGAGLDIGAQILSRAADVGADMIVMGAYRHSPTREYFFGGVTRSFLRGSPAPLFLAR